MTIKDKKIARRERRDIYSKEEIENECLICQRGLYQRSKAVGKLSNITAGHMQQLKMEQ